MKPPRWRSEWNTLVDDYKRRLLLRLLRQHRNKRQVALKLGVAPSTVTRECQRLGITFNVTTTVGP